MTKELTLIDLSSIFWQNWHATADQSTSSAFENTVQRIARIASGRKHVAICCDSPPYWRKQVYEAYKAQRDKPDEAAVDQFKRVKERLVLDGLVLWACKGFEADDVIATAVAMARADGFDSIEIWTGDKDLAQLVSDRVTIVSTQTNDRMGPAEVVAKFGVGPERIRDLLALMGDKSDNVPGVPGVGPKKAAALLLKFGGLDEVQSCISEGDTENELGTPAIRKALLESGDAIETARKLVSLRDDAPITWGELFEPRTAQPLTSNEPEPPDDNEVGEATDESEDEMAEDTGVRPRIEVTAPVTVQAQPEKPQAPQQTQAIVATHGEEVGGPIVGRADWSLEPINMKQAVWLSKELFEARVFNVCNPQAALGILLKGRALGLDSVTALTAFHFIEGQPTLKAQTVVALVKRAKVCKYFSVEKTEDDIATWVTHREGDPKPVTMTWTIKDAERADLLRPSKSGKPTQWEKMPRTMLRWRCAVELARAVYPDVVMGIYSEEEMIDARESA